MKIRILLLLALTIGQANAQTVYKCEGPDGGTIFSQRPCSDEAETIDVGPTNSSTPPSKEATRVYEQRSRERRSESLQRRLESTSSGGGYVCQGARDRVKSAQERWDNVKRDGYTPDQQRYYEQLIRDRKRHADNMCR